jgi:hypothetical protein
MSEYRYNWLFAGIATALLACVVAAALIYLGIAINTCGDEVYTNIGEFQSEDAALRASIERLSSEIDECPNAELYRVVWDAPDQYRISRHSILFDRPHKSIGIEDDVGSGLSRKGYRVDEAAIKAVAEKGGTLDDLSEYDQSQKIR